MPQTGDQQQAEQEFQHWGRVYSAVIVTLVVVIIALWLFSKAFS
jgi:ABC-type glycerol-3-phosphate transport system permease component